MDTIHLIEVDVYDPDLPGVKTLRYCTGRGFTTKPSETPANAVYSPRVKNPGITRTDIFRKGSTGGASTMQHGEIVLANLDGALDDLIDYGFDGRTLTHRIGPARRGSYPDDYPVQEVYTMEQVKTSWTAISIIVRDKQYILDKPLQANLYAGDNSLPAGLDGVATDLGGKPKPLIFGEVYNFAPALVNTSKLIYQVNDGALSSSASSVCVVYDQGLALTVGADYTSETDMINNAPGAGQCRIYRAGGYFRLGSTPAGKITADVKAGELPSDRTVGQIVGDVALLAGLTSGEISSADLAVLDSADSSLCGLVVSGQETARAVLDRLCQTLGSFWTFDSSGVLRISQLIAPTGTAAATLTRTDFKNNISRDPTADSGRGVPLWKVIVKYRKNNTVQDQDLAGAVSAARRAELAEQWLTVAATDASVKTKHLNAVEVEIETSFATEAAAQAEADRQLALRSVRRDRITGTVLSTVFSDLDLGDVVSVVLPRFGYDSGKKFILIGRQPNYKTGRGEVTLWG